VRQRFLANVYKGKNSWWRYGFVIGSVVIFWAVFAYFMVAGAKDLLADFALDDLATDMVSGALPFLFVIVWLAALVKVLHRRSFVSLINADSGIHYKRMAQGFGLWILLMTAGAGLDMWVSPENYRWAFDPDRWFWLLPLSMLLVPIKTSAEELLFRGYVMQGLRLMTRRPLLLLLINGFVFTLPHLNNPEMLRGSFLSGAVHYFVWGVLFAAMTLLDNGLELSLGVHAANNIFSYLMVGTPDSVVVTPTLWVHSASADPLWSVLRLVVGSVIFYAIFFSRVPRRASRTLPSSVI